MTILFFTSSASGGAGDLLAEGLIGWLAAPGRNARAEAVVWGMDNDCFTGNYPGDDRFLEKVARQHPHRDRCRFVNAPDEPGDWAGTLARLQPMATRIRDLGYPVGLCAQDGMMPDSFEGRWGEVDALFVGGTNEFKLGPPGRAVIAAAKAHGKWVHMGRVNSFKRLSYAQMVGCDSADGTVLATRPSKTVPKMREWLARLAEEEPLAHFDADAVGRTATSRYEPTITYTPNQAVERGQQLGAARDAAALDDGQPSLLDEEVAP